MEQITELELTADERQALAKSAEVVRELVNIMLNEKEVSCG